MMKNYYNIDLPQQRDFQKQQMDAYTKSLEQQKQFGTDYIGMQKDQFAQYKQMLMDSIGRQQAFLDPINKSLSPYLSATTGFDPAQTKMLNDQAIQQLRQGFGTASSNMYGDLLSRGYTGDLPAGGDLG